MHENIMDYYSKTKQDGVIFCFHGPMTQGLLETLENTLKVRVEQEYHDVNTTGIIFSIFVEQVQNIINYSQDRTTSTDPTKPGLGMGMVIIGHKNNRFYVSCANLIKTIDMQRLEKKLVNIKEMSKEQLRTYFKEKSRSHPEEGSKGAGLGLILMARKGNQIDFSFTPIDSTHTLFFLQVGI
ncbi:MAG: SiaB family protein kinase [Magnetococcus sp. YQC-5]